MNQENLSCPNCGASIPKSSIKCGFCSFEISKTSLTGSEFIEKLQNQLEELNKLQAIEETNDKYGLKGGAPSVSYAIKKATAISTFNLPNDKENLLELFYFCDNNADATAKTSGFPIDVSMAVNKQLHPAWSGKAKMAYNKLKRFANDDDEIKALVEEYKIKYHVDAKDMKKSSINKNQGNGPAVLFGLNKTGVIVFVLSFMLCFPLAWIPFTISSFKGD